MADRDAPRRKTRPKPAAAAARRGRKTTAAPAAVPARRRRRRVMAVVLGGLAALAVLFALIWILAPREPGRFVPPPADEMPEDLDAWLYQQEGGVRPEVSRRIVWAGRPGVRTPVALVYIHGFSATSQEIRPVPDLVAAWYGANLYFARLSGHGLDAASMDLARVDDWAGDLSEAVAIGRRLGERVVIIGTSTGGTLAAMAARSPELGPQIDGVVLVSPNFALRNRWLFLARQPLARQWLPLIAGRERCFTPQNDRHREFWTSCYPTTAVAPMAALLAEAGRGDYAAATQPVLALWSDDDRIVDPAATRHVLEGWGGAVTEIPVRTGPDDDPDAHVIAGDILSPGQTAPVAARINGWLTEVFGE